MSGVGRLAADVRGPCGSLAGAAALLAAAAGPLLAREARGESGAEFKLRDRIVAACQRGERPTVFVRVAGSVARGKLVAADADALRVLALGAEMRMPWDGLLPKRFYALARRCCAESAAADHVLLASYCRENGLAEEAEAEEARAVELDPNLRRRLLQGAAARREREAKALFAEAKAHFAADRLCDGQRLLARLRRSMAKTEFYRNHREEIETMTRKRKAPAPRAAREARPSSGVRPRVFMTPKEVMASRGKPADSIRASLRRDVIRRAGEALRRRLRYVDPSEPSRAVSSLRPWPTHKDGNTGELLKMREDGRDTDALALAYALTGERRYAERAWKNVHDALTVYEAFGSFHQARKNRDLAAASMFGAIAMTWDLCHDNAPAETRQLVLTKGVRRARDMYEAAVRDWYVRDLPVPFATPGVRKGGESLVGHRFLMLMTNHCWVNIGALGNLALALEGEDVSAAGPGSTPEDWLRFAIHFFGYISDILPADGSYPESRVYGAPYAAEGASPFLRTLKRVKGIDCFARTPFFRNFAYGRMYAVWDHPRHVGISNFGEGSPDSEWHCMGWIWAFASAYRDPVLQWSANVWHRARPTAHEIAWQYLLYDPTLPEKHPVQAALPGAMIMSDMSHAHLRAGPEPWGSEHAVLSFRGSLAGKKQFSLRSAGKVPFITTWHMHESRNAVILAVGGKMLLGRSTMGEHGTRHYSVLQVDGADQVMPKEPPEGVIDFDATDRYVTFSSEIGPAYPGLEGYRRRVTYVAPGAYLLADCATARKPVGMTYRLHFGREVRAESKEAGRVVGSLAGEGEFTCDVVSPEKLAITLGRAPGANASQTLSYGPASAARESRAVAVVRLGGSRAGDRARPVTSGRPDTFGAVFATGSGRLAVVSVMRSPGAAGPAQTWYRVPGKATSCRHLVAGLLGGRRYSVRASRGSDGVTVNVSPGGPLSASPEGTLFFDLSAAGKAQPVRTQRQRSVLHGVQED